MLKVFVLFEELISLTSIYWVLMCIKYDSLQLLWQMHEPLPSRNLHSSEEEGWRIIMSGETFVLYNREVSLSFSVVLSRDLSELREQAMWVSEEENSRQSEWQCKGPTAGGCMECTRNLQGQSMAGTQRSQGRMAVDGIREIVGLESADREGL